VRDDKSDGPVCTYDVCNRTVEDSAGFLSRRRKLPAFAESLLHYIPFAILGALIFPDILYASGNIYCSAAGAAAAFILAWTGRGILVVLAGGIFATFIVSQLPWF